MPISNLATLKSALADWSHRTDLSANLDDIVSIGEQWILRNVRVREMETALSETIASGVVAVPTGFMGFKYVYILYGGTAHPLEVVPGDYIYNAFPDRQSGSIPKYIAVEGDNFIFGPYPADDYVLTGVYYKKPTSVFLEDNDIITNYSDIYLYACMAELVRFIAGKPEDILFWTQIRDARALDAANVGEFTNFGKGPLVMRVVQ